MSEAAVDIGSDQLAGATPFLRFPHTVEQPACSFQWKMRQQHPRKADNAKLYGKGAGLQSEVYNDSTNNLGASQNEPKDESCPANRHASLLLSQE